MSAEGAGVEPTNRFNAGSPFSKRSRVATHSTFRVEGYSSGGGSE